MYRFFLLAELKGNLLLTSFLFFFFFLEKPKQFIGGNDFYAFPRIDPRAKTDGMDGMEPPKHVLG
jgi:hypothetical protein